MAKPTTLTQLEFLIKHHLVPIWQTSVWCNVWVTIKVSEELVKAGQEDTVDSRVIRTLATAKEPYSNKLSQQQSEV